MNTLFLHYLSSWEPLGYIIVFLGMIFEGDAILFAAAFLSYHGILDPLTVFLASLWGMIFGDNLWYTLGRKFKNSESYLMKWAEKIAKPFDEHLLKKPLRTIFISKFTYGFNRAVIVRAGMLGTRWKKVEESDILATLLWIAIVAPLGYFSGASFTLVKNYLRFGEIALLIGLIIFWVVEYLILKKTKKRI